MEKPDIVVLASGAGVSLIGRLAGRALILLSQILLARLLGAYAFGLYAIGWNLIQVTSPLANFGLQHGVIRFGAAYWPGDGAGLRRVLWSGMGIGLVLSLLLMVAFLLLAPWLAGQVFDDVALAPVIYILALSIPLAALMRIAAAATRIAQQTIYGELVEQVCQPVTNLALFLLLFWLGWGLAGAVVATVISFGLAVLLALYFMQRLFPSVFQFRNAGRWSRERGLLMFSVMTTFTDLFTVISIYADRLFVGYFMTAEDVGIYQALSQFSFVFILILSSFNAIFAPMIARFYQEGQLERLQTAFRISTKWGLYLSLPVFIFLIVLPGETLIFLFGEEFRAGTLALVVLTGGQFVNLATGAVGFMLSMTGHQQRWLMLSMGSFLLNLLLNIVLIPEMGLVGAALATALAMIFAYLGALLQVRALLHVWPYDRRYFKGMIAAAVAAAALIGIRLLASDFTIFGLVASGLLVVLVFGGVLWLLGLDAEDREVLGRVFNRLSFAGRQPHEQS